MASNSWLIDLIGVRSDDVAAVERIVMPPGSGAGGCVGGKK
jgi:hypothetical protein